MNHPTSPTLCNYYDKEKDLVCSEASVAEVTVRTRQVTAVVPLCARHYAEHNATGANLRTASKQKK